MLFLVIHTTMTKEKHTMTITATTYLAFCTEKIWCIFILKSFFFIEHQKKVCYSKNRFPSFTNSLVEMENCA